MSILISLLIIIIIVGFAIWLVRQIPGIPEPWPTIAIGVIAIVALIWLLTQFTGLVPSLR